jgi:hypothetical protein
LTVRRFLLTAFAGASALVVLATVAVAGTAIVVLDTPRNDFMGTAEDGYFAYAQSRVGKPNKTDVWLKAPGEARIRVNATGTTGFYPNVEIGDLTYGDRLVFAQRSSGNTDLKIWNVQAGTRQNPPAGINTAAVESKPSLSENHLLFGRGPAAGGGYMTRILLFDLVSAQSSVIDRAPKNGIVFPGTVNGEWASWTECSPTDCRAWRYHIPTDLKSEVPTSARLIYTSAVSRDGVVWYMQSGIGCGVNVKLRRHQTGVGSATLIDLPGGVDANVSDLDDTDLLDLRVLFDRVRCSNLNNWAIWRADAD